MKKEMKKEKKKIESLDVRKKNEWTKKDSMENMCELSCKERKKRKEKRSKSL
jgi:hypothetical protein